MVGSFIRMRRRRNTADHPASGGCSWTIRALDEDLWTINRSSGDGGPVLKELRGRGPCLRGISVEYQWKRALTQRSSGEEGLGRYCNAGRDGAYELYVENDYPDGGLG